MTGLTCRCGDTMLAVCDTGGDGSMLPWCIGALLLLAMVVFPPRLCDYGSDDGDDAPSGMYQ